MTNISLGAYFRNFTVIYELVLILINVQIQSQKRDQNYYILLVKNSTRLQLGWACKDFSPIERYNRECFFLYLFFFYTGQSSNCPLKMAYSEVPSSPCRNNRDCPHSKVCCKTRRGRGECVDIRSRGREGKVIELTIKSAVSRIDGSNFPRIVLQNSVR